MGRDSFSSILPVTTEEFAAEMQGVALFGCESELLVVNRNQHPEPLAAFLAMLDEWETDLELRGDGYTFRDVKPAWVVKGILAEPVMGEFEVGEECWEIRHQSGEHRHPVWVLDTSESPAPAYSCRIYTASRTRHACKWLEIRDSGIRVISTWIDEAGKGESESMEDLWERCVEEAGDADALILYRADGEMLKGALVEAGAALQAGKPVYAVGFDDPDDPETFSFLHHPLVHPCPSVETAIRMACQIEEAADV